MKVQVQKIRFNGLDFILTSPNMLDDTPIATIEQIQRGERSYAHLIGREIWQKGQKIGTTADIEFGAVVDIELDMMVMMSGFFGATWD